MKNRIIIVFSVILSCLIFTGCSMNKKDMQATRDLYSTLVAIDYKLSDMGDRSNYLIEWSMSDGVDMIQKGLGGYSYFYYTSKDIMDAACNGSGLDRNIFQEAAVQAYKKRYAGEYDEAELNSYINKNFEEYSFKIDILLGAVKMESVISEYYTLSGDFNAIDNELNEADRVISELQNKYPKDQTLQDMKSYVNNMKNYALFLKTGVPMEEFHEVTDYTDKVDDFEHMISVHRELIEKGLK